MKNKKSTYRVLTIIITFFMLMTLFPVNTFAAEEGQDQTVVFKIGQLGYQVGGQEIVSDVAPYIKDDRTMVPVAFVAPALGTEPAEWLPEKRMVVIKKGDREVLIKIDSKELIVNGKTILMDVAAEIKDIGNGGGRTMLPISFVARALEVGYEWQAETRSVYFYGYNKICDRAGIYGPELAADTIQGNVIIKADGVKLQNLNIKGNLIIAEEVGQGTVTLDNIKVNGETFVRGGGANSIYLNGGQYHNIIVEKVDGKVRIVAVDAEGTAVILADETGDNEVILEGSFDIVTIEGIGITLTTLGETTINQLIIEEQAEGSAINLSRQTIVTETVVNTEADFNNEGRIISAIGVAAEESVYDYHLPENLITPSSSGGGGSITPRAAAPVFEPEAGQITAGTQVEISTTTSGASIYYTTDGSTPSTSSTLYEDAITISESVTINAMAVKSGYRNSTVTTASYTVVNSDFAGGNGTEADPYQVATAQQLDNVRDYLDKYFIQTADIDLDVSPWNVSEGWEPIGDYSNPFTGTYDGDSYTITGLTIDRSAGNYQGLFGATGSSAVLTNLMLEAVDINGNNEIGSLTADNRGTINDCYAEGSINGNGYIGILVGDNREGGTINYCYTLGNIAGTDTGTGGLVGANGGSINQCYAAASVTGSSYIGGLVGFNTVGSISDSYAVGDITGTGYTGGLVGGSNASLAISNCYAAGTVYTSSSNMGGGLIGYSQNSVSSSYYDSDTTGQSDTGKGTPKTTAEMTTQATFSGWDFTNTWDIEESPESYPYLQWQEDNIPYPPSDFEGGSGTETDPFQVATAEQLDKVRDHLDKYFIQTADINLGESPWNDGEGWVPIGNNSNPFTGSYDGDDYEISGLAINRPSAYYQGLFGKVDSGASLADIHLTGTSIYADEYLGALAGYSAAQITGCSAASVDISCEDMYAGGLIGQNSGSISDCSTSGIVKADYEYAGGLVGYNYSQVASGYAGTIQDSCSEADVTYLNSDEYELEAAGGLVGYNSSGTIESSRATGSVIGHESVGGLIGENWQGTVTDCYAAGDVHGIVDYEGDTSYYAGGLIGENTYLSTVTNSYAEGTVTGQRKVGGLVGYHSATIEECYAAGNVSGTEQIGGLVGDSSGTIENSYATGSAAGGQYVGGLVGYLDYSYGTITNSYAAGLVTTISSDRGGLHGGSIRENSVFSCYYDTDTTGQSDTGKGTPKTTEEMVTENTFTGWDFGNIWVMGDAYDPTYPYFQYQNDDIPYVPATPIDDFANASVGPFAASFTFSAPIGAVSVKVMLSSDDGDTWEEATAGSLSYESTSATVTGLTPQTSYLFKLVVEGGIHAGDSNIQTLTTGAA